MSRLITLLSVVLLVSTSLQLNSKDAFNEIQAEDFQSQEGTETLYGFAESAVVRLAHAGGFLLYENVSFSRLPTAVKLRVAAPKSDVLGNKIKVRLGSRDSPPIATYDVEDTHGWRKWVTVTVDIPVQFRSTGQHDVYITFNNNLHVGAVGSLDWFTFTSD